MKSLPAPSRLGYSIAMPANASKLTSIVEVLLGDTMFDIYLNDRAYWRNVPTSVWGYKLGGYQVLKKWLSYRERKVLGRSLRPEEVQHFAKGVGSVGGGGVIEPVRRLQITVVREVYGRAVRLLEGC